MVKVELQRIINEQADQIVALRAKISELETQLAARSTTPAERLEEALTETLRKEMSAAFHEELRKQLAARSSPVSDRRTAMQEAKRIAMTTGRSVKVH